MKLLLSFIFTVSTTVLLAGSSVNWSLEDHPIRIFPNPCHDELNISIENADGIEITITVVNIIGEEVFNYTMDESTYSIRKKIDLSDRPEGIYFVRINDQLHRVVKR